MSVLLVRRKRIRSDSHGLVCLHDIWFAGDKPKGRSPLQWSRVRASKELISVLIERKFNTRSATSEQKSKFIYSKDGEVYAHEIAALAYAEYIDPRLGADVRETYLRARRGDPTLADEILARANERSDEWQAKRLLGKVARGAFTRELRGRGVSKPYQYAAVTNEVYLSLMGKDAEGLRRERALRRSDSVRDSMDVLELLSVGLVEELSRKRLVDRDICGFVPCKDATSIAGASVKRAITSA